MKLHALDSSENVIRGAASALARKLANKKKPILLLLSGGSAFRILEEIPQNALHERITIGVLDERFSADPKINNYAQLTGLPFFGRARRARANFIDTRPRKNDSLHTHAKRYARALRGWKKRNPLGVVLSTIGIGEDGHTAGIMPYPRDPKMFRKQFQDGDSWVAGYRAARKKNSHPLRVTVTPFFLKNEVDFSVAAIWDESKKCALARVLRKEGTLPETPARIIRAMRDARIFVRSSLLV